MESDMLSPPISGFPIGSQYPNEISLEMLRLMYSGKSIILIRPNSNIQIQPNSFKNTYFVWLDNNSCITKITE